MSVPLLEINDLQLSFATALGISRALRGVDLAVQRGVSVGLVGESGCGKTMTGRSVLGLLPPNARVSGRVLLDGIDLLALPVERLREIRGSRVAMIFQDPAAALNPVFSVGEQLSAVIRHHRVSLPGRELDKAAQLLAEVRLSDPERLLTRYPYQLSGGMQQRVMIAMALSASPELLIADEPTTSLDVTVQAQILDLLDELRRRRELAVLLITHNMDVVRRATQEVAVLYAGRVVEHGATHEVLGSPRHPYTQALLAALPRLGGRRQPLQAIAGSVPRGDEAIQGCVFASRCAYAMDICRDNPPRESGAEHSVWCWLYPS